MADPADEKILTSIKAPLGYPEEYDSFDFELLMHINSIVGTLQQLGVGPTAGLSVDKDTPWSALLVDDDTHKLEGTKSYMFLRVKMLFDSNNMPAHLVSAYEKMIQEAEWRLSIASDPRVPLPIVVVVE